MRGGIKCEVGDGATNPPWLLCGGNGMLLEAGSGRAGEKGTESALTSGRRAPQLVQNMESSSNSSPQNPHFIAGAAGAAGAVPESPSCHSAQPGKGLVAISRNPWLSVELHRHPQSKGWELENAIFKRYIR